MVTADDDLLYPVDWLASLVEGHMLHPDCICARRCHEAGIVGGRFVPYARWHMEIGKSCPRYGNFFTGVGGVLYPPHCMADDVANESLFMALCPRQDDIWFWGMALVRGTRIYVPRNPFSLKYVEGTQEGGLFEQNVFGGENDAALARMAARYPELQQVLSRERRREWLPRMAKRVLRLPYRAARKLYRMLRRR